VYTYLFHQSHYSHHHHQTGTVGIYSPVGIRSAYFAAVSAYLAGLNTDTAVAIYSVAVQWSKPAVRVVAVDSKSLAAVFDSKTPDVLGVLSILDHFGWKWRVAGLG
jgi:hypothetical protein